MILGELEGESIKLRGWGSKIDGPTSQEVGIDEMRFEEDETPAGVGRTSGEVEMDG